MEVTIRDDLCVAFIVLVCIYVSFVAVKLLAFYCECFCIEYMELSGFELSFDLVDLFLCAFSSSLFIDLCKLYGIGLKCSCPVSIDRLTICSSIDSILIVWSPVDP